MKQYLDLLREVLVHGEPRSDRTGTGTLSLFGRSLRFNLAERFPAVTTKKLHFHSVITELLWFLRGDTNVKFLHDHGVHIWDEWADADGNLGQVYGAQWRRWKDQDGQCHDQIKTLLDGLSNNSQSRRHILSAWNVGELDHMALPPCHVLSQFYVTRDGRLSCQVYQRSADVFLGLPFNIASYAALTQIIAEIVGFKLGELIMSLGDVHLYANHVEQAKLQLSRVPISADESRTNLKINWFNDDVDSFEATPPGMMEPKQFTLVDYRHHDAIRAPIAV